MRTIIINYLVSKGYIPETKKEIYNYGLYVLILNLVGNGSVLFLSLIFNQFLFGILFLILFSSLRIVWGGVHAKTPLRCFFSSNIVFLINLYLYCSLDVSFSIIFNYLLIFFVWNMPALKTRNEHIFILNEKRKKIICLTYILTTIIPFTSRITFFALLTNTILHIVEIIRNRKTKQVHTLCNKEY